MDRVRFLPRRSARIGAIKHPNIVPMERMAVPMEAVLDASASDMPAFFARVIMAVGSYTAPAHRPMIATVSNAAFTMVFRRYFGAKISANDDPRRRGCPAGRAWPACRGRPAVSFHRSGSFTRAMISTEIITGDNPQRNIARHPKRAPTV